MVKKNWIKSEVGKWDIKLKERVDNSPQVEIRDGTGIVIVVSLGAGYIYKNYGKKRYYINDVDPLDETRGFNIHMALNGPLQCTFREWDEISSLILMAKDKLKSWEIWHGTGKDGGFEGIVNEVDKMGM